MISEKEAIMIKRVQKWGREIMIYAKSLAERDSMSLAEMSELCRYIHYLQVAVDSRYPTIKEKEKLFHTSYETNIRMLHINDNPDRFEELR